MHDFDTHLGPCIDLSPFRNINKKITPEQYFIPHRDTHVFCLTPVIWIVPTQDWYYEITGKERGLYFISLIGSQGGNSICAWPFQGSAVWLDDWLRYHLLQPLLHVRSQSGLGSQSNTEYGILKRLRSAADYKLSWIAMVINMLAPHSSDKDCNKNRWGQGVNFILLTMIRWEMAASRGLPWPFFCYYKLPVYNPVNRLQCHEWGSCWHKSEPRGHLPAHCSGPLFTIIIAFFCAFSPLSFFYMAFKNETGFWNIGSFIFH